jgi:hypothetical protein
MGFGDGFGAIGAMLVIAAIAILCACKVRLGAAAVDAD